MKKNVSYLLWPAAFLTMASLIPSCGGDEDPSGDGDAIGDGDGDAGGENPGDGDGDEGNGGDGGDGGAAPAECDEDCKTDNNPCTEDVCNPETGKCGIPRSGNACDDGLFCTGNDVCDEGECVNEGNPCSTDPVDLCDEGANECQCSSDSDCGDDIGEGEFGSVSEWSACEYDDVCDQAGSRSRSRVVKTCESGACEESSNGAEVDNNCGVRDTDGDACEANDLHCDGSEICAGGSCSGHTGNPCAGISATPECREASDKCVECLNELDCSGAEQCCKNACIPDGDACLIVIPVGSIVLPTTSPSISPAFM